MEYNRLPKLINTYPKTSNYLTTGIDKSSLFGLYSDVNKVDFDLASLENVTIVKDTKLRTIIAIYEDRNDETPQYYTSELYHRDLEASKVEANPYFLNASFDSSYVVSIYLKELIDSLDAYKDAELKLQLNFLRNNFIFFNNSGITGLPKQTITNIVETAASLVNTNSESRNTQIDSLGESISKLENEISNVPNKIKRRGIFGGRADIDFEGERISSIIPFNRGKQVDDIKNKLTDRLFKLKERKKELENQKIESAVSKIVTQDLKKENIKVDKATFLEKIKDSKIKPSKEKDLIEINGVFVDCILLVKYVDWVLSEPALDEIEEGGVINPTLLLDFEKAKVEVPIEKLDSNNNTKDTIGNPALNQGTGKFFEYQIIRLSIPASQASSTMTFRTSNGSIETIATADYGFIGTYCIEENSFSGNYNLYQRTQLAPCNNGGNYGTSGPGGYGGGGSYDYYDNQNRNIQYIDRQKDFQNIQ
jgi:hypothetical protein